MKKYFFENLMLIHFLFFALLYNQDHDVKEENILFVSLIAAESGKVNYTAKNNAIIIFVFTISNM